MTILEQQQTLPRDSHVILGLASAEGGNPVACLATSDDASIPSKLSRHRRSHFASAIFQRVCNLRRFCVGDAQQSAWAELREAQAMVGRMAGNTLVTTIDLGESRNVHPRDKAEVSRRAAQAAEVTLYGQNVPWAGPIFQAASSLGDSIRLQFASQDSTFRARNGPALRSFGIAGQDRRFVWADARIENGAVIVSSPAVPQPVAVRYDWADSPDGNLTNGTGLPAAPFRTDEWPGITFDQR
jgi:hypothetical protein